MATGYIDPNEDGGIDGSGWTATSTPYYATVDDGVRSPTAPNTADYVEAISGLAYLDDGGMSLKFSTLPNIGTATGITVYMYGQRISGASTTIDANEVGVGLGSPSGSLVFTTTAQWSNAQWEFLNLTQTDVDNLEIRFFPQVLGSGRIRVSAIYLEIAYEPNTTGNFFTFF